MWKIFLNLYLIFLSDCDNIKNVKSKYTILIKIRAKAFSLVFLRTHFLYKIVLDALCIHRD